MLEMHESGAIWYDRWLIVASKGPYSIHTMQEQLEVEEALATNEGMDRVAKLYGIEWPVTRACNYPKFGGNTEDHEREFGPWVRRGSPYAQHPDPRRPVIMRGIRISVCKKYNYNASLKPEGYVDAVMRRYIRMRKLTLISNDDPLHTELRKRAHALRDELWSKFSGWFRSGGTAVRAEEWMVGPHNASGSLVYIKGEPIIVGPDEMNMLTTLWAMVNKLDTQDKDFENKLRRVAMREAA